MQIEWFKTKDIIPDKPTDALDRGWVLGRYGRDKLCTVRYLKTTDSWQMFTYNWAPGPPIEWAHIPDMEFRDDRFS